MSSCRARIHKKHTAHCGRILRAHNVQWESVTRAHAAQRRRYRLVGRRWVCGCFGCMDATKLSVEWSGEQGISSRQPAASSRSTALCTTCTHNKVYNRSGFGGVVLASTAIDDTKPRPHLRRLRPLAPIAHTRMRGGSCASDLLRGCESGCRLAVDESARPLDSSSQQLASGYRTIRPPHNRIMRVVF